MTVSLDSDTKSIIEASLDRFVDEAYSPHGRHTRLKAGSVDYRQYWPTLAEIGVFALGVKEELGGIGGSAMDVADAFRVLSRGLVLEPLVEAMVIAGAVLRHGDGAEDALAELLGGESLPILVGGRVGDELRCEVLGDQALISGVARVVPGVGQADVWLIACQDADGVARVFKVERSACAAQVQTYRLMDAREAGDVVFERTAVPLSALWLAGEAAQAALTDAAVQAVNAYCAEAVGVMQCAVKDTGEYLKTREQFGVTIGTFQALQHKFANMHMFLLEARAISRELSRGIDRADSERTHWLRYAAPTVVARCGDRIGHEAIQLHGGMGVSDELIISHYNSRLVVLNKLLARWAVDAQAAMAADH